MSFALSLRRIVISEKINSYRRHADNIETLLEKEANKFVESIKVGVAQLPDHQVTEYENEYFERYENEYLELAEEHPSFQRKSELICIYALLENGLKSICLCLERVLDNPVKLDDLSASGNINKAKKYLEKVANINFPSDSPEWKEIIKIQQLRNCLVHNDGIIKKANSELIPYVKDSEYLKFQTSVVESVAIKRGFTVHCLDLFEALFDKLFVEIKSRKM